MKKFLLSLVALIGAVSVNAQNNLYIEVGETENTSRIPVNVYIETSDSLAGFQASYALPGGLEASAFRQSKGHYLNLNTELWPYDEDNDDYAAEYYAFQNNTVEMFTKSKPNDLLISMTAAATGYELPTGSYRIGTFYFNGSTLTDGSYEITQYTATIFPDAKTRYDIDHNVKASFTIQDGKVTGTSTAINEINANGDAAKGIYNIAGQRLNTLQKGLNIVDGKKVYVK